MKAIFLVFQGRSRLELLLVPAVRFSSCSLHCTVYFQWWGWWWWRWWLGGRGDDNDKVGRKNLPLDQTSPSHIGPQSSLSLDCKTDRRPDAYPEKTPGNNWLVALDPHKYTCNVSSMQHIMIMKLLGSARKLGQWQQHGEPGKNFLQISDALRWCYTGQLATPTCNADSQCMFLTRICRHVTLLNRFKKLAALQISQKLFRNGPLH